jgi:hypothetical protein
LSVHIFAVFFNSLMYQQQSVVETANPSSQLQDSPRVDSSQPHTPSAALQSPPEKPRTGFVSITKELWVAFLTE